MFYYTKGEAIMKTLKLSKAIFLLGFFLVGLYSQAQTQSENANLRTRANLNKRDVLSAYKNGQRDFSGWNLTGANLTGANLTDANLTDANLKRAYLKGIKYNDQTKWPVGFNLKKRIKQD